MAPGHICLLTTVIKRGSRTRNVAKRKFEGDKLKFTGAKVTDEKHPSKLELSSAICQSLVTQCSMTPTEADTLLNQTFSSALELKELEQVKE
jgi:hypothetical protein